jgi:hypothetical protein
MSRKIFQVCLLFAAMIAIAFGVSWIFSKPPVPPSLKPLPSPNGYTLLVNAGAMVTAPFNEVNRMTQQELRSLVDSRSNSLQLARAGLNLECQVPLQYSEAFWSNHIADVKALRLLSLTIQAEGRLAELENRPRDALKSYLDLNRLGLASARGGVAADAMIGQSINGLSQEPLQRMLAALDASSCREVAETLEALDAQGESWKDISERSEEFRRQVYSSLKYRLTGLLRHGTTGINSKPPEQAFRERLARSRQLMLAFAARAYELEHGQKAGSFTDLVPAYLKAIPTDPLTGTNMVFTP